MQKKNKNDISTLVLLAKQSGKTSFSSLFDIKHALNTDKVGHTGTLDSFADGLLVVLTGHLTHLVPHITGMAKTYLAVVCFGTETDTLDPAGKITAHSSPVDRQTLEKVLPSFTGTLLQTPPLYSAVHVNGQRASDAARNGKEVHIEPRQIFVYENSLVDFRPEASSSGCSYALLKITCSKGTYIRSLARDIAKACGSCAHLIALRRVQVGPFRLEDACGAEKLPHFNIDYALENEKRLCALEDGICRNKVHDEAFYDEIRNRNIPMNAELAVKCGFDCYELKKEFESNYMNGRPLKNYWFTGKAKASQDNRNEKEAALFYENGQFAGILVPDEKTFRYGFVVKKSSSNRCCDFKVFSYEDVTQGRFPSSWAGTGTALSIGSFDGLHLGHVQIINRLAARKDLVPGIITFRSSVRNSSSGTGKDVFTLEQKLYHARRLGLKFAVVIDFSPEIATIDGVDFLSTVKQKMGLKFLAEGTDFNCGKNGSTDIACIKAVSSQLDFELCVVPDVIFEGKRISSSRIREAVADSDFDLASRMLDRPFTYDCSQMKWSRERAEGSLCWFSAACNSVQVRPADGTYRVTVTMSEVSDADCVLKDGRIYLLLPENADCGSIQNVKY